MLASNAAYSELHCHSCYSFLDGVSPPDALVGRAAALGMPALALTDHDGLYGVIPFVQAARAYGIKPIIGAELLVEGNHHLTLLARNVSGYRNLCRLVSIAHLGESKKDTADSAWSGKQVLPLSYAQLATYRDGLLVLSGCRQGPVASALLREDMKAARRAAAQLHTLFGKEQVWIELQRHYVPNERRFIAGLVQLAGDLRLPVVATNNVHYARRAGHALHDIVTCIRQRTTVLRAGRLLRPNSEFYLKSPNQMARLFRDLPLAIQNTVVIAEQCDLNLDFTAYRLPEFPVPPGETPFSYLYDLCYTAIRRKYHPISLQASNQFAHELDVIQRTNLAGYFLVVWDIVQYARAQGIRCQGRGSAGNSLVAYLLDITPVDPLKHNLLFERFLSTEAATIPDIDLDFAADRREEVIQYVYARYGAAYTAMVANVVTFQARSAMREVGKALGLPVELIEQTQAGLETHQAGTAGSAIATAHEKDPRMTLWPHLARLCTEIDGLPRHLSIHAGGMLVAAAPLVELLPLERATAPNRVVVPWDKTMIEDAGLIKIDLLSLKALSVVSETVSLIAQQRGVMLDIDHIPLDDAACYKLARRGDTLGVFQLESRAQQQCLPRLRPSQFEDLVAQVSIIRPGPIQGGMVHPFIRRKRGEEPVKYPHPSLEPILAETYGVILYQEQCLKVAMTIGGFSGGEADRLRRLMSRNRSRNDMAALRERFISGAAARGIAEKTAAEVWGQLEGFATYGFPKSHAVAFAFLAYQTLYLKAHYQPEFICALLNQQPLGFYPSHVLLSDAQRHGVRVRQVDINQSQAKCILESVSGEWVLQLGFNYVADLGEAGQARLLAARQARGTFRSVADFCRRTRLTRAQTERLIQVGAFDSLRGGKTRRQLLWALGSFDWRPHELELETPLVDVELPTLTEAEQLAWEYAGLGLSANGHVMQTYRERLRAARYLTTDEVKQLPDGAQVCIAGLMVVRQRPPTAKGVAFISIEDEFGLIDLVVRPNVYEKHRAALRNGPLLLAAGRLQRVDDTCSILLQQVKVLA